MKSNFDFLDNEFPVLAQFGKKAELYLYSDSNSCLMKLGMIGETVVNLMFTYDRITLPAENTAVNRIVVLFREGLLTQDLVDILHALRKVRNKAVHENYASVADGKVLLQMAHSLCEWFMQTYGDWNYKNKPFILPADFLWKQVQTQVQSKSMRSSYLRKQRKRLLLRTRLQKKSADSKRLRQQARDKRQKRKRAT